MYIRRILNNIYINGHKIGCFNEIYRSTGRYLNHRHRVYNPTFLSKSSLFNNAQENLPTHDPEKGHLVYVGPMTKMVKYVKAISVSTSAIGIAAQPFLFSGFAAMPSILQAVLGGTLGIFIFVNPIVFHWVAKRYITSLYYDSNSEVFTAHTLNFFVRKKTKTFKAEEVNVPDIAGMFTTFKVGGVPLLLDPSMFQQPEVYKKLMGYDKPLDFSDLMKGRTKGKE